MSVGSTILAKSEHLRTKYELGSAGRGLAASCKREAEAHVRGGRLVSLSGWECCEDALSHIATS